jgi:hypothetical protein
MNSTRIRSRGGSDNGQREQHDRCHIESNQPWLLSSHRDEDFGGHKKQ